MQTDRDFFVSIWESVNNEVTKFIQRYVYCDQEVEGVVETRMRQYCTMKLKQKQCKSFYLMQTD